MNSDLDEEIKKGWISNLVAYLYYHFNKWVAMYHRADLALKPFYGVTAIISGKNYLKASKL